MFLIAIPKHDIEHLSEGVAIKINGIPQTLFMRKGALIWNDGSEHVKPIICTQDIGALVSFTCGDGEVITPFGTITEPVGGAA